MAIGPDPGLEGDGGVESEGGGGGLVESEEGEEVDEEGMEDEEGVCSGCFSDSGFCSSFSGCSWSFSGGSSGGGFFEFTHRGAARVGLYLKK